MFVHGRALVGRATTDENGLKQLHSPSDWLYWAKFQVKIKIKYCILSSRSLLPDTWHLGISRYPGNYGSAVCEVPETPISLPPSSKQNTILNVFAALICAFLSLNSGNIHIKTCWTLVFPPGWKQGRDVRHPLHFDLWERGVKLLTRIFFHLQ